MKTIIIFLFSILFLITPCEAGSDKSGDPSLVTGSDKILVLGLDGATWDIIDPLIERGELPNIKSLKDSGSYGTLVMTEGMLFSPVIWTSMFTGVHPDRHGLVDEANSLSIFRKQKAVWNYLGDSGRPTVVLNIPGTFPPEKIPGCMVSGFPFENSIVGDSQGTFFSLRFETDGDSLAVANCEIMDIGKDRTHSFTTTSDIRLRDDNYHITLSYNDSSYEVVISEDEWSQWLLFQLTNGLQVKTRLRVLDSMENREMNLYLSPLERIPDNTWSYSYTSVLSEKMGQALNDYDPLEIGAWGASENPVALDYLYDYFMENETAKVDAGIPIREQVDGPLFIHIIVALDRICHIYWPYMDPDSYEGIDPAAIDLYGGLVDESYIAVDRLVGRYLETIDENTTVVIVSDHGFHSIGWRYILGKTLADLKKNFEAKGFMGIVRKLFGKQDFFIKPVKGVHKKEGIYIISGKNIKKGYGGDQIAAVDVAPTVLYILGEKIPDDLDGRILDGIFQNDHLNTYPPRFVDGSYGKREAETRKMDPSVVEQLKSMGYLD